MKLFSRMEPNEPWAVCHSPNARCRILEQLMSGSRSLADQHGTSIKSASERGSYIELGALLPLTYSK